MNNLIVITGCWIRQLINTYLRSVCLLFPGPKESFILFLHYILHIPFQLKFHFSFDMSFPPPPPKDLLTDVQYSRTCCAFCSCAVFCLLGPSSSFPFKHNAQVELLLSQLLEELVVWLDGCVIFLGGWWHDFSITFDLTFCFEAAWVLSAVVC